jgi:hypothetical protein
MKFPVFSLLTGNFGLPETSSLLTPSSSGESGANLVSKPNSPSGRVAMSVPFDTLQLGWPPATRR